MARRFLSDSTAQLEAWASKHSSDLVLLREIHDELAHRQSTRARRLQARLQSILSIATQAPISARTTTRPAQLPTISTPVAYKTLEGRALFAEQERLRKVASDAEAYLQRLTAVLETTVRARDRLRNELNAYLSDMVPGFVPSILEDPPQNRFEAVRRAELDRLRTEALRRWPSRAQLEAHSAQAAALEMERDTVASRRTKARVDLAEITQFIDKNMLAIASDVENEVVKEIAVRLGGSEDDFALLKYIRQQGQEDAVSILARARLYRNNVLCERGGSEA